MTKFLKRNINNIFIMLGNSCNMNCAYCLQHPLVEHPIASTINEDIYEFIKQIQEENEHSVNLQFYGGEPLIYFDNIKAIVENTKDIKCTYSIICNGKAITQEMVDFFNEHEIPVTISWDGRAVLQTRGYDVFDPLGKQRDLLLQLKYLGLSGVISSKIYPKELLEDFQSISDEYYKIHQYGIRINLDEIMDTGIGRKDLVNLDYEKVYNQMAEMADDYIQFMDKKKQMSYCARQYIESFIGIIKSFYLNNDGKWGRQTCMCGNGYSVLNLDLQGDLYSCHNGTDKVGTIYYDYFKYLNNVIKSDAIIKDRIMCEKCPALFFCKGGCKLIDKETKLQGYCTLKRAISLPVIEVISKYGEVLLKEGENNG